jgi:hypothetical protein
MSFPTDQSMLMDPNGWIANTAATAHTTPHVVGMSNSKQATSEDSIMVGNGAKEQALKITSTNMETKWV